MIKKEKRAINPDGDGVSHINIYSRGRTELGRALSHFDRSPFTHPEYGNFESMEGFWYYIKSAHSEEREKLRTMYGWLAKKHGRKLDTVWLKDFKSIILTGNYHKINQNMRLKQMLIESTLPFEHYYMMGPKADVVVCPEGYEWLIEDMENLRERFKAAVSGC